MAVMAQKIPEEIRTPSTADWKGAEREGRALEQRAANDRAAQARQPLPFPNLWDRWDPTKVDRGASPV